MKNVKRIILAVWAGSMVMAFQNCAQEMGGSLPPQKSSSSTSSSSLSCSGSDCNQTCSFDGAVLAVGESVTAYQSGSVSNGASCVSESRTCQEDGSLSGSYPFASCHSQGMTACLAAGNITILDGSSRELYTSATVPYGQSCNSAKVTVSCSNGVLSNSGTIYSSCSVETPVYKWVNVSTNDLTTIPNHATVCHNAGLRAATDQGYGTCASGKLRPNQGGDFDKISFGYGQVGNAPTGKGGSVYNNIYCVQTIPTPTMRYQGDQEVWDPGVYTFDRIVAFLCY